MARHHLGPAPRALHGYFSRELTPALRIDSGDVVSFQIWDSDWGAIEQEAGFSEPRDYVPRDLARDVAHPLAGPVAINGARAGMTWKSGSTVSVRDDGAGRPGLALHAARSLSGVGPGTGRTSRRNHRAARGSGYILGARSGSGNRHRPFGAAAEAAAVHGNNGYAPRSTGHSIHLSSPPGAAAIWIAAS